VSLRVELSCCARSREGVSACRLPSLTRASYGRRRGRPSSPRSVLTGQGREPADRAKRSLRCIYNMCILLYV
jgi:hypothetical protein